MGQSTIAKKIKIALNLHKSLLNLYTSKEDGLSKLATKEIFMKVNISYRSTVSSKKIWKRLRTEKELHSHAQP